MEQQELRHCCFCVFLRLERARGRLKGDTCFLLVCPLLLSKRLGDPFPVSLSRGQGTRLPGAAAQVYISR